MPAVTSAAEFVSYIDAFLAAEKYLVGLGVRQDWRPGRDDGCWRVKYPIEVDGEQRGESLIVDAYPDRTPVEFYILIEFGQVICRVDFEPNGGHTNDIWGPVPDLAPLVSGPHYHAWELNKHYFKSTTRAIELHNAIALPDNLRRFAAVFRWFAAQNNIRLNGPLELDLPPRTRIV